MAFLTSSPLLEYILESANAFPNTKDEIGMTSNHFIILALTIVHQKEINQLPEELNTDLFLPEIESVVEVFKRYNIDKQNTITNMRQAINDETYNPCIDEMIFRKIIGYKAFHYAKKEQKPEVSAEIVLNLIFSEPTDFIQEYIVDFDTQHSNNEDNNFASAKPKVSKYEEFLALFDEDVLPNDTQNDDHDVDTDDTMENCVPDKNSISDLVEKIKRTHKMLLQTVFGQEHAINIFISGCFQAELLAMTNMPRVKPRGTFLFAGPPGVGKTFLAETAAEMFGLPFMRYDMSEYSDKEANLEFCGSDKVYKNGKAGNVTSFVDDNPKCILLFDEIEKAHMNVIYLFLQILDAGRLRDNHTDEEVSFRDTIIIFTTNAGKNLYQNSISGNYSGLSRKAILRAIETDKNVLTGQPFFPAAICSRFSSGNVVMFNNISADHLTKIVKNEILTCAENIEATIGIKSIFDNEICTALLFSEGGGADARAVKSRASGFFYGEIYELLRLVTTEKTTGSVSDLESVHFSVDLPTDNEDIKSLFGYKGKPEALVFGSETLFDLCRKKIGRKVRLFHAGDIDEAKNILCKNDIQLILCDIAYDIKPQDSRLLNIEDVESKGRDFFWYVMTNIEKMPLYLLRTDPHSINSEEELSFTRAGARGVMTITGRRNDGFRKTMLQACEALHQQNSMSELFKASKVVRFETAQSISDDGKTAEIRLFDFELGLAADADDSRSILGNISKPNISFDQIIGAKDAKEELSYFIQYLKSPRKYLGTGVKAPKGVLLYGPPGTGKTMLAKAMAAESDVTFITAEGNQFLKKYVGEGAETVHNLFNIARKYAPSILFVDEIDAIAKERRGENAGSAADDVVDAFLSEMDGFKTDSTKPVFVLAATNYSIESGTERSLDAAMLRRFDRCIYVDLPDKDERISFLHMKIAENSAIELSNEKIENIAVRSTGMSLASLESIIELALRTAIRTGEFKITDAVFEEAFETFNSGEVKKWDSVMLERTARHEAGHAYISWVNGDAPSYITIVARSNHGGYIQHGDNESKGIYTRDELLAQIRTALAGRAAEVVYYGETDGISTGAGGDLQTATRIAKHIICTYGMDKAFGMATIDFSQSSDYVTVSEVRSRINKILSCEYEKAKSIIEANRETVDGLVKALLVKNHLSGEELKNIFVKK